MHIQLLSLSDTIEMLDTQSVYMLSLSTNKIYRQAVNCSLFSSFFFLFSLDLWRYKQAVINITILHVHSYVHSKVKTGLTHLGHILCGLTSL